MKYSIIIPTYNHCEDLLRPCIESLVKYTDLTDVEIVVVANGCTDNTREYVNSLGSWARLVWHDSALGYTRAANEGIRASQGQYLVLLNNDTEILPSEKNHWLMRLYEPFVTDSNIAATGTLKLFDQDVQHDFLVFCCVMISRDAFDKLGLLDEIFSPGYGEDIDFCMRILDSGRKFVCIDRTEFVNGTNVGNFPLWHKGNKTFENISEYSSVIVKRNQEILRNRYQKRKINLELQQAYEWCRNNPSDIYQHIHTLRRYARNCDHVTELGSRDFVSYYGLAAGLPKKIVTYDIDRSFYYDVARPISDSNNIELVYKIEDTRTAEIEPTDLIFFDTLHTYDQLKVELAQHANKSRKYLLFHDTSTFELDGEYHNKDQGIWPAIQEFLDVNPQWQIKERFTHNHGLTVLEKTEIKPMESTKSRPKFSIIIPTYNHCDDLLRPCIESIKKYTDLSDIELIVVANGCTDNTREYVNSLGSWARLIWHDQPLGYPKSCNLGIRSATGEFVVLLNNDTELLPQPQGRWLEMLHRFFKDPAVGIVSPLEGYDPYTDTRILIFFYVMIRREVFDRIGYLDEIFSPGGCEDIDFSYRAMLADYRCVQATDDVQYRPEAATNSGGVPIWHKDNRTFGEIKEYKRSILRKNNLINAQRWNKNIKLSLGANQFRYSRIPEQKYFSVVDQDTRADFWISNDLLDFAPESVTEILSVEFLETLDPNTRLSVLSNWSRVLKPQGQLTVEFLDLEKVIGIYPLSDDNGKLALANIMQENRSGMHKNILAQLVHDLGFENIKIESPKYSQSQIYSRLIATKNQKKTIPWDDIKNQDLDEFREIVELNSYVMVTEEIQNSTVIDIGSNIGMFSLLALHYQAARIIAVEPQKQNFQRLRLNVNQYPEIETLNLAVYSQDNQILNINNQGSCSNIYQGGEPVSTITLQTLLDQHGVVGDDLVLKIDCEAAEYDILPQCSHQLLRRFKIIMMEIHTQKHPVHQGGDIIYDKLQSCGFVKVSDVPLIIYNTGQELGTYIQKWVRQ